MATAKAPPSTTKQSLTSLYAAWQLYTNWGQLSDAQKARGVAALGLKGYQLATGTDLSSAVIVSPSSPGGLSLTLGQAFDLFSQGYNAYALAKNWDQLNTLQKVTGGTQSVLNVANLAKNMGLLGSGSQGSAVKGVTAQALSSAGWASAPNYGVGAVTAPAGTQIPAGYSAVASGGEGVIAVPIANAGSAQGAIASQNVAAGAGGVGGGGAGGAATSSGITLGQAAGGVAFAAGAYQVSQGWGMGGTKGATNGALGGAAMAGGLYAMGMWNPYVAGGLLAVSVLGNAMKVGKSGDQAARDGALGFLKQRGYVTDQNTITLPDGTVVDLGIDGHGNLHTVKNANQLTKENQDRAGENKLNYWDTDYTNDLDFFTGSSAITLTTMLGGGTNKALTQLGGKIGNGALQNIGYGQEFTPENFSKAQQNMRAIFSQMGIKSKADGYQLLNQMYAENRINDADLASFQHNLSMVFNDDGYQLAQKLYSGRMRGVEVASADQDSDPHETVDIMGSTPTEPRLPVKPIDPNAPGVLPFGKNTFNNPPPNMSIRFPEFGKQIANIPGGASVPPLNVNMNGGSLGQRIAPFPKMPMDKDSARARNQVSYFRDGAQAE